MTAQSDADFLEALASEVKTTSARVANLESAALEAQLGLGTPARTGVDLSPVQLGQGVGAIAPAFLVQPGTDISHANADVLINSSGITVTNGKIIVRNGAATVIIDGSSNMFKIAASGSLQVHWGASPGVVTDFVTLTGLGTYSALPLMICNTTTDDATVHASTGPGSRFGHVAHAYSGSTEQYRAETSIDFTSGTLPSTLDIVIRGTMFSASPGIFIVARARYYVLIEAGI